MSNETVDIGGQTLKELDDQGSRLTRIEEGKIKDSTQIHSAAEFPCKEFCLIFFF